jgi:colicin import membrane protein
MKKLHSFFALLLMVVSVFSQSAETGSGSLQPLDIEGERSRIQSERTREEALNVKEEAACYARFAVTNCLGQVRVRRREVLDKLRRQEIAINDAERKKKGLEQIEQIRKNSSPQRLDEDAARRLDARATQQEREERANQKASAAMKEKSSQPAAKNRKTDIEQGRTVDNISKEQQQYNDKLREAQEHRASREKINNENAGTSSKPLPEAP